MGTTFTWDAMAYRNSSGNEERWARELVEKLHLKGNERVLDVGCGDGRITAEVASSLEQGSVLGIDFSKDMIEYARRAFPPDKCPNLSFQVLDFRDLDFVDEFDVIFSNAAIHWVKDQLSVLKRISVGLKPQGRLLLQQGGKGAEEAFHEADQLIHEDRWKAYFEDFELPFGFYGTEEYTGWLKRAGLTPVRVELLTRFSRFDTTDGLKGWIHAIWLPYTQRVPENLRDEFVDAVAARYLASHPAGPDGMITVRMIRLEVEAKKLVSSE